MIHKSLHPVVAVLLDEEDGVHVVDKIIDRKTRMAYVGLVYSGWEECWQNYYNWVPRERQDIDGSMARRPHKFKNILLKYPPMIEGVGSDERTVVWWPQVRWTQEVEDLVMEFNRTEAAVADWDEVPGITVAMVN